MSGIECRLTRNKRSVERKGRVDAAERGLSIKAEMRGKAQLRFETRRRILQWMHEVSGSRCKISAIEVDKGVN